MNQTNETATDHSNYTQTAPRTTAAATTTVTMVTEAGVSAAEGWRRLWAHPVAPWMLLAAVLVCGALLLVTLCSMYRTDKAERRKLEYEAKKRNDFNIRIKNARKAKKDKVHV